MPNDTPKLQPWQIFHVAIKTLTAGMIARIFGKANMRTAYLYGQDPATTEQRCKNPLEALHMMFTYLVDLGRSDVVRAAINYLKTTLDDCCVHHPPVCDLQPTLPEEILMDHNAICAMQQGMDAGLPIDQVDNLKNEAIEEVNRSFAKYVEEKQKSNGRT